MMEENEEGTETILDFVDSFGGEQRQRESKRTVKVGVKCVLYRWVCESDKEHVSACVRVRCM